MTNLRVITTTNVPLTTEKDIIHRTDDIFILKNNLLDKNLESALLINGFGGVGKSSIARILYSQLSKDFDQVAWIDYKTDFKSSLLSAFDYSKFPSFEQIENENKKYEAIISYLKNNGKSKLIFIDNVDVDEEIHQDPLTDKDELIGITSWPDTKIIITSRLPQIPGYRNWKIYSLDEEKCIDLFKLYYKGSDNNEDAIQKLNYLAGYNSMIIELLAKSAYFETSLMDYYNNLDNIGFCYPDLNVTTTRIDLSMNAAQQLKTLFSHTKRSEIENYVLWDFVQLAEGEKVSINELKEWLGYSINAISRLVDEGWINNKNNVLSIHPLIRQSLKINSKFLHSIGFENSIQRRTDSKKSNLMKMLLEESFFSKNDTFSESLRKLNFAEILTEQGKHLTLNTILYIGDFARKISLRKIPLTFYETGYQKYRTEIENVIYPSGPYIISDYEERDIPYLTSYWKICYWLGYMYSYTHAGFEKATELLKYSLSFAHKLYGFQGNEFKEYYAMSLDHMGYVLSFHDNVSAKELFTALHYFLCALNIRSELYKLDIANKKYLHDLAWTEDNLGTMLIYLTPYMIENVRDYISSAETSELYSLYLYQKTALVEINKYLDAPAKHGEILLRQSLARRISMDGLHNKKPSTEVPWTMCNLAHYLSTNPLRHLEAQQYYTLALNIYKRLEEITPGLHAASTARTYRAYALLLLNGRQYNQAIDVLKEALSLNEALEKDHPGVYIQEIKETKEEIKQLETLLGL